MLPVTPAGSIVFWRHDRKLYVVFKVTRLESHAKLACMELIQRRESSVTRDKERFCIKTGRGEYTVRFSKRRSIKATSVLVVDKLGEEDVKALLNAFRVYCISVQTVPRNHSGHSRALPAKITGITTGGGVRPK